MGTVKSQVDLVNKQNNKLTELVLSNQKQILQQRKLLSSPGNAISVIKSNAKKLMLGSLVQNVKQAALMNQVSLANQLWFDNMSFLKINFNELTPFINKINKDFANLVITNDAYLISSLAKLASTKDQLKIIDLKARYKSLQEPIEKVKKKNHLIINKDKANWWERQKDNSKKYLSDIWGHIKNSVVISDSSSQALF